MKKSTVFLLFVPALFLCFGCPNPEKCDVRFQPSQPFALDQGKVACSNDDGRFSIRFDSVTADSRCPVGVQCVWAGRADLALTMSVGGTSQSVVLAIGDLGQGGAGETTFEGYTIRLESIEPPAQEGRKIEQKDYKAGLRVIRGQ